MAEIPDYEPLHFLSSVARQSMSITAWYPIGAFIVAQSSFSVLCHLDIRVQLRAGISGGWRTLAEALTSILLLEGEPLHGIRYAAYGAIHVRSDRVADINLVRSSFAFFA